MIKQKKLIPNNDNIQYVDESKFTKCVNKTIVSFSNEYVKTFNQILDDISRVLPVKIIYNRSLSHQ